MTEYDLRQWRDKSTTIATINIAEAKFETWRTRVLFTEINADADDTKLALKELMDAFVFASDEITKMLCEDSEKESTE